METGDGMKCDEVNGGCGWMWMDVVIRNMKNMGRGDGDVQKHSSKAKNRKELP